MRYSRFFIRLVALVAVCLAAVPFPATADKPASQTEIAFFETQIRPVLVEHCYSCHNSAETAEGGLAVDFREGLREGGDGGRLIVPGDPAKSRLMAILKHEIDGLEMPQDGAKLDDRVLADFEKWIVQGAADPRDEPPSLETLTDQTSWAATMQRRKKWWCFQPIGSEHSPAANDWSNHPIDQFVLAKQKEMDLAPAAAAEPAVLIRRLFINLAGLPPRVDEFDQWMHRYSAAGVTGRDKVSEDLIDHLLASSQFGERWARHWMDWIRYAESHGSEGDPQIDNSWMYRDYLIRALNADVPYDQLVREHVAGDLISQPRINADLGINESIIAPAHWRMVFHGFAPTDALDEKVRFVDDQVNAFSKAFLGLTVSCARCHDHKFDAISQADYYALFGILASCRPARAVIDLPSRQNVNRDLLIELKPRIRDAIALDWLQTIDALPEKILSQEGTPADADQVLRLFLQLKQTIANGTEFAKAWQDVADTWSKNRSNVDSEDLLVSWDLSDPSDYGQWSANGLGLPKQPYLAGEFAIAASGDSALTGIFPAGIYSNVLSAKYPARLTSADVSLEEESELWVRVIGDGGSSLRYVVQDYPRNGTVYPVTNLNPRWSWQRFDLAYWKGDTIHVELTAGKDAPLLVRNEERSWFGVTEARLLRKGSPNPLTAQPYLDILFAAAQDSPPKSLADVVGIYSTAIAGAITNWRSGAATSQEAELLDACMRQGLLPGDVKSLTTSGPLIEQYRQAEAAIPNLTRVPGLEETVGRTQPLFLRGDHKKPGDIVPHRFLEAIDAQPYRDPNSGRLHLAEDLLRDDNPLTRRVIVNRLWHHLFGRGIVATPDNFGRLGQQPTHPELLDWLANRFVTDGWSLKKMIRVIVTSKTWQLSSTASGQAQQHDPNNTYLSHANIRRMEAEAIRDSILSVSGRLDRNLYGSPVDGNSTRRSVYVQVIRNSLDPFLRAFDFPEPFSSAGRRDVTNVPAQSLTLMNDPRVADHAAAFAATVLSDKRLNSDELRIERMFVAGLGRKPSVEEIAEAKNYVHESEQSLLELQQRVQIVRTKIDQQQSMVDSILDPVRDRLMAEANAKAPSDAAKLPQPIGCWEFKGDLKDRIGNAHGTAKAGAAIESDGLVVAGGSYVVTAPLEHSLTEKTLEAWVRLDNLQQRGGGVITLQTLDGVVFDSIVFAERDPKQWMAGSNGFSRTQGFKAPQETEANKRSVHLAIAYHSDGRIVGYRDGKPYGEAYKSSGPFPFKAGQAMVGFGIRHLPAGGNRMLAARIQRAQLYDRALTAEEIAATASGSGIFVSQSQVMASLGEQDRIQVQASNQEIERLKNQVEAMGPIPEAFGEKEIWTDLARAMFTFKEFIYVR